MDLAGVPGSTDRINVSDSDSDEDYYKSLSILRIAECIHSNGNIAIDVIIMITIIISMNSIVSLVLK